MSSNAAITVQCPSCRTWNRVHPERAANGPKCGKCAAPIALDHPVLLDDSSFARTIAETTIPVLVDFYADWCGPCKMMAPGVEALAAERAGRVLVAKLDTDASQRTAAAFSIRGLPTCIVFNGGVEVRRQSGAMPKAGLDAMLGQAQAEWPK